jgi:hypothetical protein
MLAQSAKGISRADILLIPVARSITTQVQMVVELFNLSVLDLTPGTIRLQLQQLELQTRGVRAADSLHAASAIAFDADILVSTDDALLQLDGILYRVVRVSAAPASPPAVLALVTGAVAGHDASAFGAERGITHHACVKRQRGLRIGFGGTELRGVAGLGRFGDA